jgi:hypothetical protein
MHKFKVKLKITGFELEVEGTKDQVALITSTVSNQLRGMVQPNGLLGEKTDTLDVKSESVDQLPRAKTAKPRKRNGLSKAVKGDQPGPIELNNDPSKYGTPVMEWSILQKGMWILYVAEQSAGITELSARAIADTYAKYFKQVKIFRPSNISRDFGGKKTGANAFVAENPSQKPARWYLLEPGKTAVKQLITEQKK